MSDSELYDLALKVTDGALGKGTYADLNRGNPDPGVQAAIKRAEIDSAVSYAAENDAHDPRCYQSVGGIPDDLPDDVCDCRVWALIDAHARVIPPGEKEES
jgi:hypothetical protein